MSKILAGLAAVLFVMLVVFVPLVVEAQGAPTPVTIRAQSIANRYTAGYGWSCTHNNERCFVTVKNGTWRVSYNKNRVVVVTWHPKIQPRQARGSSR